MNPRKGVGHVRLFPRFDFVQFPSLFFGAFAETGQLEPLDDYLAQYEGSQQYLDWVMPAYREFYTKWSGKTYGVMLDGDIHILHYRKSYFENPELQKKFSARFQQELAAPKTWDAGSGDVPKWQSSEVAK